MFNAHVKRRSTLKTNVRLSIFLLATLAISFLEMFALNRPESKLRVTSSTPKQVTNYITAKITRKELLRKSCTVTLTGNTCVNSELSITSSSPVASISWLLDGVSVYEQTNTKQNNGQVVAGGNGSGAAANQLYNPNRLFVDREGNLYIPDMANNRVQKWAPGATSGVTIAGGNGSGSNSNQFNRPTSVTVDKAGNLYVVDQNNSRIQKWIPGATSGITIATSLSTPTGICMDSRGNLYVSEQNGQRVLKFTNATAPGVVIAGGNGYGSSANQLASPTGIFVDEENNIYICDTDNYRVQKWVIGASSGITVARTNGNPLGVYVDGSRNIYVSDYTGFAVQKWATGATSGITIAGGNGSGSNPNQIQPAGIWMDAYNNLYVSDFLNGRVIKFSNIYTGTYTTLKAGTYTASVTTTDGCVAISNAIIIKDNVTPKITISSNNTLVCSSFQPTFTAEIVNGGNAPILQWKINGTNINGENGLTFTPKTLTAQDVVTCNLTNAELCVTTAPVNSNSITLNTPITEIPSVSIVVNSISACEGSKLRFNAIAYKAGNQPTYQWKVNNTIQAVTGDFFESETLHNNDVISCSIVSNALYCQAIATANSNEIQVQINPILTPTIKISSDLVKIYNTSTVTFKASATNEGINPSYRWFLNGIKNGSNSITFTASNLKQGDEISCELSSSSACLSTNTVVSNSIYIDITVVIKVKPPNTFTPNGDGTNDFWTIDDLKSFPKCKVSIYNRNGTRMFYSVGYQKPWAGDYKNISCAPGVYYYVINIDGTQITSGSVTIIK